MEQDKMDEIFKDAFNILCGDKIGYGVSRTVYDCFLLPGYVVKVETGVCMVQNIMEMEIWLSVVGTKASRWFAECKSISPNGKILIQEKTRQPSKAELLDELPIWFSDIKLENFGMVPTKKDSGEDGKEYLVCHDYGYSHILHRGTMTSRMQKVKW